ncbi:MAG: hypothetical protein L0387_46145 [Acidobacteria bacterium]|nr:hypothetical protein [Acidobacteriota bacterium]
MADRVLLKAPSGKLLTLFACLAVSCSGSRLGAAKVAAASQGLSLTGAYTWSKNLTTVEDPNLFAEIVPPSNFFDRSTWKTYSRTDQPHVFVTGFNYQLPGYGWSKHNRLTRLALSGWTLGGVLRYASGTPIRVPVSNNNAGALFFKGTFAERVPGEPLFTQDLNCHCIDPHKDFVLNPKAWRDPAPGQFGGGAVYYGDYRYARRYDEQLNFGKVFTIRESMTFQLRMELFNVFNRTYLNNPDAGNAGAAQVRNASGVPVSGFTSTICGPAMRRPTVRRWSACSTPAEHRCDIGRGFASLVFPDSETAVAIPSALWCGAFATDTSACR